MQVTRINDTLELARLATAWDRLAGRRPPPPPPSLRPSFSG